MSFSPAFLQTHYSKPMRVGLLAAALAFTSFTSPVFAQAPDLQQQMIDLSPLSPSPEAGQPFPALEDAQGGNQLNNLPNPAMPELNLPTLTPLIAPDHPTTDTVPVKTSELDLKARLIQDGIDISTGLVWRVFAPEVGDDGELPLIASAKGGSARFNLPQGSYLVHAAYGRAGATKRITLSDAKRQEVMILDAGGVKLSAVLPDNGKINEDLVRFSIYTEEGDSNDRSLIIPNVKANTVVRLNSGTYHVVSNYGTVNATIRADIRVEAGKLTEATVQHRAAQVTLMLVREKDGEAIADTSWSILNQAGDSVHESVGAYSTQVLSEGQYIAVAKNKERIYQSEFSVKSGMDEDVKVIASKENETDQSSGD